MVTKEELIELLNKDLILEYAAAVQYINHSALMTGAQFGSIIKELKVHATEEMMHAQTLADQIAFLGGKPAIDVGKVHISDDNVEMLKQDLDGELDAIRRPMGSDDIAPSVPCEHEHPHTHLPYLRALAQD